MDLRWVAVVIAGCVGLAGCIAAALLGPMDEEHRKLRPLANVGRLTALPEYVRAARLRMLSTAVMITVLVVAFAGAVVAGARPTGLPTAAHASTTGEPEDIMLCLGAPATEASVVATFRYFADEVRTFGTQRIGLTTANRRVIPLTRDYQYVAGTFGALAAGEGTGDLVSSLSYADYAGGTEDLLALCLSGFPSFEKRAPQRRSVIYVGPDMLRRPGEQRPALFTPERVRELTTTAGVQVNAIVTGPQPNTPAILARATGGLAFTAGPSVATDLAAIRDHPPAATADGTEATTQSTETPDVPVLVALLAAVALATLALGRRR
jgi:MYXO-CTERM domain-containing protein